jgi:hypothetical protein
MKDVAHISFEGGGFIIPVETPYDRELLFEHAEESTKRHGSVRLDIDRRHWTITTRDGPAMVCATCPRWPEKLTYRFDGKSICRQCARRALH